MIHITRHALSRAIQRIAGIQTESQARAMILAAIQRARAEETGAPYVRLGTGERIVIEDGAVVTVLPRNAIPALLSKTHDRRRQSERDYSTKGE